MDLHEVFARLTPSSETLSNDEVKLAAPFFTNADRSVVALRNLPEAIKGALFSRYSRSAKGVRRLFLDEFFVRGDLGLDAFAQTAEQLHREVSAGEEKAEAFYQRILSDYGDDSVGELGGAHLACQEVSQVAARALVDGRLGLAYLEKSSRYVSFDDRVNGEFRYYRPRAIMQSPLGATYVATMDGLFESYARHLPRMIEHLSHKHPVESLEFENALTGEVIAFNDIADDVMRGSAQFAYRQAVRARACDVLRCFLPMATLTNVGVWGNGRALEYLLVKLYANPLEEVQVLAHAA
ncbi:MAG: FAD-dependent thymidylate synthase, partial [Chloroflexi bacterium]|nr:FAD-dependent thymidylate synthase [Chloroflexota bacterium]